MSNHGTYTSWKHPHSILDGNGDSELFISDPSYLMDDFSSGTLDDYSVVRDMTVISESEAEDLADSEGVITHTDFEGGYALKPTAGPGFEDHDLAYLLAHEDDNIDTAPPDGGLDYGYMHLMYTNQDYDGQYNVRAVVTGTIFLSDGVLPGMNSIQCGLVYDVQTNELVAHVAELSKSTSSNDPWNTVRTELATDTLQPEDGEDFWDRMFMVMSGAERVHSESGTRARFWVDAYEHRASKNFRDGSYDLRSPGTSFIYREWEKTLSVSHEMDVSHLEDNKHTGLRITSGKHTDHGLIDFVNVVDLRELRGVPEHNQAF